MSALDAVRDAGLRTARSVAHATSHAALAVLTLRRRHADARARAICPVDAWAFTPLYTEGTCPLCGWAPPGYRLRPPLMSRLDWYWMGMIALFVASAVMLAFVLSVYLNP